MSELKFEPIENEVTALSTQSSLKAEVKRTLDKIVERVNLLSELLEGDLEVDDEATIAKEEAEDVEASDAEIPQEDEMSEEVIDSPEEGGKEEE